MASKIVSGLLAPLNSTDLTFTVLYGAILLAGALVVLNLAWGILSFLWFLVRPGKNLKKYGSWAVVTGATDGIGFATASEIARKGLNLVLISRDQQKLEEAARKISSKYPNVQIEVIAANMASTDPKLFAELGKKLAGKEIGVLINNVGRSYEHPEYLDQVDQTIVNDIIQINVNATTQMTRLVLPGMLSRKKGAIVNVGSAAGELSSGDPLVAVYSGSKAFVSFFSKSLNLELKHKGIDVQCQVPYFVVSNMSKIRKPSLTIPTPAAYARASVRAIGYEAVIVPFWAHAIMHKLLMSLPVFLVKRIVLNKSLDTRRRALAKKEREAKSSA